MEVSTTTVQQILTRTSGYLTTVASHSLQPYCGCALGNSLCGVGCYVRHNFYITRGRPWGSFVEARTNAAEVYARDYRRERDWARRLPGAFGIFLSSSTEPFQPLEQKMGITRAVLERMVDLPPDFLILQSHSHHVADYIEIYRSLATKTDLRVHITIETDYERLDGLPPHGSSVANRLLAAKKLRSAGIFTVATVAPLLPIEHPNRFFQQLAEAFDAVVVDHYIGGDGTADGGRTLRTPLPQIMRQIESQSVSLAYREQMVEIARSYLPGRVGVNIAGFAGRWSA